MGRPRVSASCGGRREFLRRIVVEMLEVGVGEGVVGQRRHDRIPRRDPHGGLGLLGRVDDQRTLDHVRQGLDSEVVDPFGGPPQCV